MTRTSTRSAARKIVTNTCAQNYKFTGKERDLETGNDDFGARYYSSNSGRFLSADWSAVPAPIPYADLTNPQTLNLYQFVKNDPETFADVDGHLAPGQIGSSEGMFIMPRMRGSSDGDPGATDQGGVLTTFDATGESETGWGSICVSGCGDDSQTNAASQNQGVAQNQSQTKQLTADDVSKGIKAYDSDKGDKQPGRVVKALDTMGTNFTATGDVVRAGVKQSGVDLPKDADKVLGNVDSISRTGNNVVITNKDSMTIMVLGQIGKTISFTINESVKGKSGYQGPALQNLKGVGIGIGRLAKHPDHWGPE